jgi:hypothetical protein
VSFKKVERRNDGWWNLSRRGLWNGSVGKVLRDKRVKGKKGKVPEKEYLECRVWWEIEVNLGNVNIGI